MERAWRPHLLVEMGRSVASTIMNATIFAGAYGGVRYAFRNDLALFAGIVGARTAPESCQFKTVQ